MNLRPKNKFPFDIDFLEETTEYFQVKWSFKNDCLIFVDKGEKFVFEFDENGITQKKKLH